ncbi:MAG: oligosaccharide flippase family protein [Erysipelotrichaceae bacterium]
MKKKIIRSTFYLIFISLIAKLLSFSIRIFLARSLSTTAMNYYALASPTMVMVITLAQMGIPSALSKVIAQQKNHRSSLKAAIILSLINNSILVIFFILFIPFLSQFILKQVEMKEICYTILPLIPMVSLSGILKGYLLGTQLHLIATGSQIFEELSRIIYLIVMFYINPSMNAQSMASIAMFSITIGEVCSSLYMLCFVFKTHKLESTNKIPLSIKYYKEILDVSLPMVGSRFIGSLTYFFEPIVMVLALNSKEQSIMVNTYGILNGYLLPLITMPSFITITLSNVLLPAFTFHFVRGNVKKAKKLFNVIISICFMIGIVSSYLCYNYSEELLILLYKNTHGASLLKSLAWPFAFYSLQPALSSMLHALSRSKRAMFDTLIGSLIRILCVTFFNAYGKAAILPFALCFGMIVTTILHAINISIALIQDR